MLRTEFLTSALIVMIALTLLATPAGAITLVNNETDWLAQTAGVLTITFETLGATPSYTPSYSSGLTLDGVTFTGLNWDGNPLLKAYDSGTGAPYNYGSDYLVGGGYAAGYLLATLPAGGAMNVGFNFMTITNGGKDVVVTVFGSEGQLYSETFGTPARPNMAFLGLVSDVPITSVKLSTASDYQAMDNFSFGSTATPEPGTMILGAVGLVGLWFGRRLRRLC